MNQWIYSIWISALYSGDGKLIKYLPHADLSAHNVITWPHLWLPANNILLFKLHLYLGRSSVVDRSQLSSST
jgi:hypothetical protein